MYPQQERALNAPRELLNCLFDFIWRHPHFVWVPCATVSLSTSKYLLVDQTLHYPLHLQLLQHTTALVFLTLWRLYQRDEDYTPLELLKDSKWAFQIGLSCVLAVAAACTSQTVLHFYNIAVIAMLPVISLLVEQLLAIVRAPSTTSPSKYICFALALLSCGGILYGDYRLTVNGLLFLIPAFALVGLFSALYWSGGSPSNNNLDDSHFNILNCATGVVVTAACAAFMEDGHKAMQAVQIHYIPLISINLTASGIAIGLGKTVTVPFISSEKSWVLTSLVGLTGFTGFLSTFFLHRSYVSILQPFLFVVVVLLFNNISSSNNLPQSRFGLRKTSHISSITDLKRLAQYFKRNSSKPDQHKRFALYSISVSWAIFLLFNFSSLGDPLQPHVPPSLLRSSLDRNFQSAFPTEIVINMYHESLPEVSSLLSTLHIIPSLSEARVHIYTKDPFANTTTIQEHTNADAVTQLPNIGREGETYLNHIISQWDSLAHHTLFLQADIHNTWEAERRLKQYFDPQRTGMLSLGFAGVLCKCGHCMDRWGWEDTTGFVDKMYSRLNPTHQCTDVLLSYKGQFIVSAKRIRGIDKQIYEELREALVDKKSWAHQEEYVQGRNDSLNAPLFGYTLERLWNTLFQCSGAGMDVAWKCASLLSGTRLGGDVGDCQCFDE